MKELRKAIAEMGCGVGQDIVKVDMFLNHRLDTGLMFAIGQELGAYFRKEQPDIILTVEASGIAIALATAHAMGDIPVVFAKRRLPPTRATACSRPWRIPSRTATITCCALTAATFPPAAAC